MKATIRDNTYIVATFHCVEADDPQQLSEEIGSEIHQLLIGRWICSELTIEFDRAAELKGGGS